MCVWGEGTNGVEEPAGLAQLLVVGGQLRLQAAVLVQQVGHQQAGEVGTAGARQHLVLHLREREKRTTVCTGILVGTHASVSLAWEKRALNLRSRFGLSPRMLTPSGSAPDRNPIKTSPLVYDH